jgi:hypothetical protein
VTPGLQGQELGNQAPHERIVGQHFNPYKLFPGILIPEALCKYKGLSARLSDIPVATEPRMERATSAFDTLDDLGATG